MLLLSKYIRGQALPVHDAIAVKQGDAEWAKEAMSRLWTDETLGCKARLKVDYPD